MATSNDIVAVRLKAMSTKAAQIGGPCASSLVTEFFGDTCVQAVGRLVRRNTLDGMQETVEVRWFMGCKRTAFKAVYRHLTRT